MKQGDSGSHSLGGIWLQKKSDQVLCLFRDPLKHWGIQIKLGFQNSFKNGFFVFFVMIERVVPTQQQVHDDPTAPQVCLLAIVSF
jgi:hypothetical protein